MMTKKSFFIPALVFVVTTGGFPLSLYGVENQEVLTLEEAALLLRVDANELLKLATKGKLPAKRIGTQWRFHRLALLDWLKTTASLEAIEPLATTTLTTISGQGTNGSVTDGSDKPLANTSSSDKKQETIGEKSNEKTADQVFLRDQGILLKKGQTTVELDLYYLRNDYKNHTLPIEQTEQGRIVYGLTEIKNQIFSSAASLRYGILDDVQGFINVPFNYQISSENITIGPQNYTLSEQNRSQWGYVTTGVRYGAVHENLGYPSVILSVQGLLPTDTMMPYGLGGSIALAKSLDPAVLFANVGFQHTFDTNNVNYYQFKASDTVNALFGIAYALNDTLTLSSSLSSQFTT